MQFDKGARVFTVDGKEVGRINRVVTNPNTKQVTVIVIACDEKHIGNVEQVFASSPATRATHILISNGLLLEVDDDAG